MQAGVDKKDLYKVSSIIDRKKAIKYACEINSGNDVILVAGKGHEKYQINGFIKINTCQPIKRYITVEILSNLPVKNNLRITPTIAKIHTAINRYHPKLVSKATKQKGL